MSLVDQKDFARVVQLDRLGLKRLAKPIMDILRISDINEVYQKFEERDGVAFIDAVLDEFKVDFDFYEEELRRIPETGPFITVSNHPLGGIDGIILIKLITQRRPDYKVMANFLLQKVAPLQDYFLPVNPFDNKGYASSYSGLKAGMAHLKSGAPLGIFPAGEVSTYQFEQRKITDKPWETGALRLIQKMEVPVVPVYFQARNSAFFYLLSLMHPTLRTAKLPSEIRQQKNKSIRLRIGRPIGLREQRGYPALEHYGAFLRQRTYLLRQALPPRRNLMNPERPPEQEPLAEATEPQALRSEIEQLEATGKKLLAHKHYALYLATAEDVQALLRELGRLRECTFRAIGEGTNRPLDLDHFDYHYHHLILWDDREEAVAGAYRLGLGPEIYQKFGINGFYAASLFKIKKPARPLLAQSLEMGRAFIVPGHQQQPMPLFLLWKGITEVLRRHPELKFISGCASISNRYAPFSKSLMVQFLLKNYGDGQLAKFIKPRNAFKAKLKKEYQKLVLESTAGDIPKIDRLISDLEPDNKAIPVLIKKYLKQNARMVCFNVDPLFNDSLDGFMYIHVQDLPEETRQR